MYICTIHGPPDNFPVAISLISHIMPSNTSCRRRHHESQMVPILEEPESSSQPTLEIHHTRFQVRRSGDLGYRSRKVTIENDLEDGDDYGDLSGLFDSSDNYLQPVPVFEDFDEAIDPSYINLVEETAFYKSKKLRRGVCLLNRVFDQVIKNY